MPTEFKPTNHYSNLIEAYWISTNEESIEIIPDGTFNILITNNRLTASYINKEKDIPIGMYLIPLILAPVKLKITGRVIGIRFKAFAHKNIFERNDALDLIDSETNIYKYEAEELNISKKLHTISVVNGSNIEKLIEPILKSILLRDTKVDYVLRNKINYILERKGNLRINEMANDFNISRQALHKYFYEHIKLSPKRLADIWKFNNLLLLMSNSNNLTDAALESGYFDQAHSIKYFKEYFYSSPKTIKRSTIVSHVQTIKNRFNNSYDPVSIAG